MENPETSEDNIHCGRRCPNLVSNTTDYALCSLTGNALTWQDYWVAECKSILVNPIEKG